MNKVQFIVKHTCIITPVMLQRNTQHTHVGTVAESSHLLRDNCSKIQKEERSAYSELSKKKNKPKN